MRKFFHRCFVGVNDEQDLINTKHNTTIIKIGDEMVYSSFLLKLSEDVISDQIIPYFDAKTLISFAGVCSEWRRIVKSTKVKGVQCISVQYNASNLMFQSLTETQISGLTKGDLNEIFSEFSFDGHIGRKFKENVTFQRPMFKRLFNSKKIESLTLQSTNIITKDIPSRHISPLTSLKLIDVDVKIEQLRIICNRLDNLTELTLIGTNIDKRAGQIISNSKLKNLTHLTIGDNIGSEGAEYILNSNKLRNLKKLEFVDVMRALKKLEKYCLVNHVSPIDPTKFPILCSFTSNSHFLSKEGIMNVLNSGISWKELTFVSCTRPFDDNCLLYINKITSIEKLCLDNPYHMISSSTCKYLSSLQNLTHLEISVDNDGFIELCNIEPNNLKHFCNYGSETSEISEHTIQQFCDTFQNLTFLKLNNTKLGPGCMYHISQLPNLTDLRLERTNVDTESIKHISSMNLLKSLTLGSAVSCEELRYLCHGNLINLKTLIFSCLRPAASPEIRAFDGMDAAYLSVSNFPKLTYLSIEYGLFQYNNFMKNLASGSSLKHLKHLELYTSRYDEPSLLAIMNNLCPQYLTILRQSNLNYEKMRKKTASPTKIVFYEGVADKFISLQ
ncbi:hypothetical protein C9374_003545 [Naegleria lovaniensis]|uniref:F-box domain-containing protein n=1 Tax=Naegleria lovaniensis TaxID=51637 RepID=A0AA88GN43_NAELO|nr:uncharacterized protein C9374_003545 [Naegleria lovaniensis]KAG2385730.1 hypothetical protein C9374_003545 [Naegleria lovaniensis]